MSFKIGNVTFDFLPVTILIGVCLLMMFLHSLVLYCQSTRMAHILQVHLKNKEYKKALTVLEKQLAFLNKKIIQRASKTKKSSDASLQLSTDLVYVDMAFCYEKLGDYENFFTYITKAKDIQALERFWIYIFKKLKEQPEAFADFKTHISSHTQTNVQNMLLFLDILQLHHSGNTEDAEKKIAEFSPDLDFAYLQDTATKIIHQE